MASYEERMESFISENKEKLDKLKSILAKLKVVNETVSKLKGEVQNSLEANNLQGYSDEGLTISKKSGSMRWDFVKTLTKEEKDEIRADLVDTGNFEYRRTADSWSWRLSDEKENGQD